MVWSLGGCFGQFSPPAAAMISALALAGCAGGGGLRGAPPRPSRLPCRRRRLKFPPPSGSPRLSGAGAMPPITSPRTGPEPKPLPVAQCNHPYVIGQGPSGGVMMYLADQSELQELRLKGSTTGRNYIGPPGPPGGAQDREVVSFDGRVMLLRFTDPEISGRYGTGIYVRCAPSPGGVAQQKK